MNNQESKTTKMTPFFANNRSYSRIEFKPLSTTHQSEELDTDTISKQIEEILDIIHIEIKFAQVVMTANTDKYHIPAPHYIPSNKVWLSTHNLKTCHSLKKLDWKNIRLFEVIEVVGSYAYQLALPKSIKVYFIFHIWLLEPVINDSVPG